MAITRAQQVRQMYKEGSKKPVVQGGVDNYLGDQPQVVVPRNWQSGPDKPPTELAYITEAEKKLLLKEDIHGSLKEGPNEGPAGIMSLDSFGDIGGAGASGGDTEASGGAKGGGASFGPTQSGAGGINKPMSPADVKLAEQRLQTIVDNQEKNMPEPDKQPFQVSNFINNLITNRRKGAFNLATMIPGSKANITKMRKAYADYLESMGITPSDELLDTDNLYNFFDKQAFEKNITAADANVQPPMNYGDFILEKFGSPGVKFSGNVGNIEVFKKPDGTYGYREKTGDGGGDGGINQIIPVDSNATLPGFDVPGDKDTTEEEPFMLARAFKADGGMMSPEGGIMDLETGRQMYFLGKLVKKATRAVKKIAKSPIGKAALIGATAFGIPGTSIGGLLGRASFGGAAQGLFGTFGPTSALQKLGIMKSVSDAGVAASRTGPLAKFFGSPLSMIGAASVAAGLLTPQQEEQAQQLADNTGFSIEEARNSILQAAKENYAMDVRARGFKADGGLMRLGYQEGGDAEPVAKKTMPLLDMDGKEKDYRETGGFVDMGRMERADDVPARLSKNEFVFTADAVRNAGDGSVDKGAEVMYNMMKNLEAGGEVSEESQGLEGARRMFQTSQRLEEVL
jgi:hypothetical protein